MQYYYLYYYHYHSNCWSSSSSSSFMKNLSSCIFLFASTILIMIGLSAATPTCDDSWQSCVGSSAPCVKGGCWGWPANPSNTAHKEVIKFLADAILTTNFPSTAFLLDENACINVPGFGIHLCGRDVVVSYLYLPLITDAYVVTASSIKSIDQEGLHAIANLDQSLYILTKGITIQPFTYWEFEFNDAHQIKTWTIATDTYMIANALDQELDLNSTSLCTSIQSNCQGTYQQFTSVQSCIDFMNGLRQPANMLELGSGNTKRCRAFHNILAGPLPEKHCSHAGPQVIDPAKTPCTDPGQYVKKKRN